MLTILELSDVTGRPRVKLDLPGLLRIGDPLALAFTLQRCNKGRYERLSVRGRFLVTAVGIDSVDGRRQVVSVDTAGKPPTWMSIRKPLHEARVLPPAKAPRTPIS